MLKTKKPILVIFVLTFVFCMNFGGLVAADDFLCPGPFSTFTEDWQYDESWIFKWDPDNPDEIDRNSSVEINVIGGVPPYTWSVSGNGFSLSEDETQGLSNTLNADDTACGTAEITVTDGYGTLVTGHVRCTAGHWEYKGAKSINSMTFQGIDCPDCPCHIYSGPAFGCDTPEDKNYIDGYQKWYFDMRECIWEEDLGTCDPSVLVWRTGLPLPTCGGPLECCSGACIGDCIYHTCLDCAYYRFRYYEWECP